ncbi:MAG: hypothetical protein ACRC3G_00965 [Bacteroidales bacterium]
MRLKDIFTINKKPEISEVSHPDKIDVEITVVSEAAYTARGTKDAGFCGGSPQALLPKLHAVYLQLARFVKQNATMQQDRKSPLRQKISGLEAHNLNLEHQMEEAQEKLMHEEQKIESLKKEIDEIKDNPSSICGDSFVKVNFAIGLSIIILLTVYLFVFYSSAAYSAFFRDFTPDDAGVVKAIFDAQALGKAWVEGITEFIFILVIPTVFLGLGYLIHKFSESKGIQRYFKTFGFLAVTFIFDFILAYAIVKELHDLKIGNELSNTAPPMSIGLAFQDVKFWMIIFAGFIVYLIWGFVFSFVMSEYEKMDRVRYAIKQREKKISDYKIECKNLKENLVVFQTDKNNTQGEINKLRIRIESYVLYFNDVRENVNNYFAGWVVYMRSTGALQEQIYECEKIKENFLIELRHSEFIDSSTSQLLYS